MKVNRNITDFQGATAPPFPLSKGPRLQAKVNSKVLFVLFPVNENLALCYSPLTVYAMSIMWHYSLYERKLVPYNDELITNSMKQIFS